MIFLSCLASPEDFVIVSTFQLFSSAAFCESANEFDTILTPLRFDGGEKMTKAISSIICRLIKSGKRRASRDCRKTTRVKTRQNNCDKPLPRLSMTNARGRLRCEDGDDVKTSAEKPFTVPLLRTLAASNLKSHQTGFFERFFVFSND